MYTHPGTECAAATVLAAAASLTSQDETATDDMAGSWLHATMRVYSEWISSMVDAQANALVKSSNSISGKIITEDRSCTFERAILVKRYAYMPGSQITHNMASQNVASALVPDQRPLQESERSCPSLAFLYDDCGSSSGPMKLYQAQEYQ